MEAKGRIILSALLFLLLVNTSLAAVKTFQATEGDTIKIEVAAIDPNGDFVKFYFPQPFDEKGIWHTEKGDAGEYNLEIVASDGMNKTIKPIKLIIANKNDYPQFVAKKITVNEGEVVDLKTLVRDPDNDSIKFTFAAPFDRNGFWKPSYNEAGSIFTDMEASDGEYKTKSRIEVQILDVGLAPVITGSFFDGKIVSANEGKEFSFAVNAIERDGQELSYNWLLDQKLIGEERSGKYYFNYGKKAIKTR